MGTYYPAKDDHCFNATECPLFWQHHKISVVPVNFATEDYIHKIRIAAMTGMSFNIIAVIIGSIILLNGLRKNDSFVDGVESMEIFNGKFNGKDKLSVGDLEMICPYHIGRLNFRL